MARTSSIHGFLEGISRIKRLRSKRSNNRI